VFNIPPTFQFFSKRRIGGCAAAAALALLSACGPSGRDAAKNGDAARLASLEKRLDALAPTIQHAEDVAAIERLMRTYGYYLDRGLWDDLIDLMTDDAIGNYPAGVFVGRESLYGNFFQNNGRGYIGFEEGRLGNHIPLQPVISIDPNGVTAHGRWHVLAQLGQYGQSAFWAGGIYEIGYRKEKGVWKIARLDYYDTFSASAADGWGAPPPEGAPAPRPGAAGFRDLPHPPDSPRDMTSCPAFPGVCIPPFHYPNPGTGKAFVSPLGSPK
jgi:hypothetical protein